MKNASQKFLLLLWLICFLAMPDFGFAADAKAEMKILQEYQLIVTGLKCESCIPDVRGALKKVPGVQEARITKFDKSGTETSVEVEAGAASGDDLVSALERSGFHAKVTAVGEPRKVALKRDAGFLGLFH